MTVLIDPAIWPNHGTVWGHLVSDASLTELHEFARRAGIPDRGFDHDHYDYPVERYDELVGLGAEPVSGRELIRRLRASGLRVPERDRRSASRPRAAPSRSVTTPAPTVAHDPGARPPLIVRTPA